MSNGLEAGPGEGGVLVGRTLPTAACRTPSLLWTQTALGTCPLCRGREEGPKGGEREPRESASKGSCRVTSLSHLPPS